MGWLQFLTGAHLMLHAQDHAEGEPLGNDVVRHGEQNTRSTPDARINALAVIKVTFAYKGWIE